jgi:hypothetical protein
VVTKLKFVSEVALRAFRRRPAWPRRHLQTEKYYAHFAPSYVADEIMLNFPVLSKLAQVRLDFKRSGKTGTFFAFTPSILF